jgi:hypothetical protein
MARRMHKPLLDAGNASISSSLFLRMKRFWKIEKSGLKNSKS